jgi:hypothetical protein
MLSHVESFLMTRFEQLHDSYLDGFRHRLKGPTAPERARREPAKEMVDFSVELERLGVRLEDEVWVGLARWTSLIDRLQCRDVISAHVSMRIDEGLSGLRAAARALIAASVDAQQREQQNPGQ